MNLKLKPSFQGNRKTNSTGFGLALDRPSLV